MKKIAAILQLCFCLLICSNACVAQVTACDTLFDLASPYDTPEIYTYTEGAGYLSGNNIYGDIAKAEGFSAPVGARVNGALLSFGYVSINASDSANTITVYLWNGNGVGGNDTPGAPGSALDSATISLGAIAAEVTASSADSTPVYVYVPFTSSVAITDTIFYVGVVLPVVTGDTVALFTSSRYGNQDGNGWQEIINNNVPGWYSYGDEGYYIGNFIKVTVCQTGYAPMTAFSASPLNTCSGDTVHFTDLSTNSPTSWLWTFDGGNPSISMAQNPAVTYSAAGTYNVKLIATNFFGPDSITKAAYINIYKNPNDSIISSTPASNFTTANGVIMVISTQGSPAFTYVWSNGDSGAILSNVLPDYYNLTVTDGHGCRYVHDSLLVSYLTGITALSANNQIKIYPNPAGEEMNIEWSRLPDAEISIIDMNGKTISQFIATGSLLSTFDIHDLSSGTYVIRVTERNTNLEQSVIFEKL